MQASLATRIALAALLVLTAPALRAQEPAPEPDALEQRAAELAALFVEKPELPDGMFHRAFLEKVPVFQMVGVLKNYYRQGGACASRELVSRDSSWQGRFLLHFEKQREATMTISIEPTEPHAIIGLFLTNLEASLANFDQLASELDALPGRAACCLMRLGEGAPELVFEHAGDEPLAIGSTFKLYVLGALLDSIAKGERHWKDVIELQEGRRSLPSGALSEWPAGAPLTLYSLAGLMISQSDNTAADHLLLELGRERIEALLEPMGNEHAALDRPFLSTAEMFRLKGCAGGAPGEAYLALDVDARRTYLDQSVAPLPLDSVSLGSLAVPTRIDTIEWFASCADLCRAMDWLRRASAAGEAGRGRALLAINGGLPTADRFPYAGYKGGSEGGVLNLTWLLERADGARFAFSTSWNDGEKALDEPRFFGLAGRALGLVATAPAH